MARDRGSYFRDRRAAIKREREEKEQEEQQQLKKRREQKNASARHCRARLSKVPSTQDQQQEEAENDHRLGFPSVSPSSSPLPSPSPSPSKEQCQLQKEKRRKQRAKSQRRQRAQQQQEKEEQEAKTRRKRQLQKERKQRHRNKCLKEEEEKKAQQKEAAESLSSLLTPSSSLTIPSFALPALLRHSPAGSLSIPACMVPSFLSHLPTTFLSTSSLTSLTTSSPTSSSPTSSSLTSSSPTSSSPTSSSLTSSSPTSSSLTSSLLTSSSPTSSSPTSSSPTSSSRPTPKIKLNGNRLIIDKKCWIEAVQKRCEEKEGKCSGTHTAIKVKQVGEYMIMITECTVCLSRTTYSNVVCSSIRSPEKQRTGPGIKSINLEVVASVVLSGGTWGSYSNERRTQGLTHMCWATWSRAEKMVWNVVKHLAKETFDEQATKYVKVSNVLLTLAGDGAWSHRRNANHGVYSIVDTSNNKVLYQVVLSKDKARVPQSGKEVTVVEGNYEGTSKGMEAEGFRRAIDWLEEKKLLPQLRTYVCDQDSSVLKILNEDARLTNVKIVHDPGHLKNNFQKDLQKILGESQKGKKYSAKIGAWLMTAIKESERWAKMFTKQQTKETVAEYEERLQLEMVGEFQRRMKFAKAHYFEKKCDDHCPHLERIVDLDSMDRSTPFTALPPEILFHIATQVRKGKQLCLLLSSCKLLAAIGRHPTLLKRKKGCDCEAKEAGNDGKEKVCDRCKKEYCDDGNGDPVWIEKIQKVKEKIDSIVEKADVFMHGYHTCHNENLNMCRTKDAKGQKHAYLWRTSISLSITKKPWRKGERNCNRV